MKTAMQEFIERLQDDYAIFLSLNVTDLYLELEKQQIINAVNSQRQMGWDEKGEKYYNETFK